MTKHLLDSFDCPGCRAKLQRCGIITYEGQTSPVFQCDVCKKSVDFFGDGELVDVAYTFTVTPDGRAVDPADPA